MRHQPLGRNVGTSGGPQETFTASKKMTSLFFKIQQEYSMSEVSPVSAKAIQPVFREGSEDTGESDDLLLGVNWASSSMQGRAMTL